MADPLNVNPAILHEWQKLVSYCEALPSLKYVNVTTSAELILAIDAHLFDMDRAVDAARNSDA
jgi:hypothetical protein